MSLRSRFEALLAQLPKRVGRYGYDVLRGWDLRGLEGSIAGSPLALLGSHDLSLSGAPRIVLEMAKALRDRGRTVVVIAMADGPMRAEFEAAGAAVLIDARPRASARYLARLARRAEIAIANTVASAPLVVAWARVVPTIWYLHEVSTLAQLAASGRIDVPLANAADIWAGSELSAAAIRHRRPDVAIMPYGVEPVAAPDRRGDGEVLEIGVFGSIERRKGQDLALEGLRRLSPEERKSIRLRLFGRVLEPDFAAAVLRDSEAIAEASFEGERDRAGYIDALASIDAVLVCSRDDTLPLVSIDALSAGRMLLLTRSVGTVAWLEDEVDALIEQEPVAAAMQALFSRALAARPRAATIAAAARARFARSFSQEAFVQRFFARIDEVREKWR